MKSQKLEHAIYLSTHIQFMHYSKRYRCRWGQSQSNGAVQGKVYGNLSQVLRKSLDEFKRFFDHSLNITARLADKLQTIE